MPLYNNTNAPYSVSPGDQTSGISNLVNAERLTTLPNAGATPFSQRVAIQDVYGYQPRPVVVMFSYATVPASVQYDIFVAWDDLTPPGTWTKIGSTTNVNGDQVTIQRTAAGGNQFRFLCVREVMDPGVAATVKVQQ